MILQEKHGDITYLVDNPYGDIIIAMNTELKELTRLGRRFVGGSISGPVEKGSVLTFKYDELRRIHMIVIHDLEPNGWDGAEEYLRYGLDDLWKEAQEEDRDREFSIVQIGKGPVGRKYGADPIALRKAMEDSHLNMTLFIQDEKAPVAAAVRPKLISPSLQFMRISVPTQRRIPVAA